MSELWAVKCMELGGTVVGLAWRGWYSYNNSQIKHEKLGHPDQTQKMVPFHQFVEIRLIPFIFPTMKVKFESIREIIFSCSCFYNESYQYVWGHYLSSYHWERKYDFKLKKRITYSILIWLIFIYFLLALKISFPK